MKISSLASIIAATLSAGGAIGGYFFFKPRDLESYLKWKGYTLASSWEEGIWKSIYEENKDKFNNSFGPFEGKENDKWKSIRKYCIDILKKKDYYSHIDKAINWCLDTVNTVSGQLIRNGKDLESIMSKTEEYKVATAVQGNPDFWVLVGAFGQDFENRTKAYQKWCQDSLKAKPKSDLVRNVDVFCSKKPYSKFSEKLSSDGYERFKDAEKKYIELGLENLAKFTGSNLLEIVGGGKDKWKEAFGLKNEDWKIEKSKFKELYEKYCGELDNGKFEDDNYSKSYSNYKGICAFKKN